MDDRNRQIAGDKTSSRRPRRSLNSECRRWTLQAMRSVLLRGLALCLSLGSMAGDALGQGRRASTRLDTPEVEQADSSAANARVDAKASFARGQVALDRGDLEGAEIAFREVLAVDSQAAAAYSNLGVIAMRRKDWDRALTLL